MYKISVTCISPMIKDMRLSRSLIRNLHHIDDYIMRSEIIPHVPDRKLNESRVKVTNFQPFPKTVSICMNCNGTGWKTQNDGGPINTVLNLQFKFVLCKKCKGTGFH